MDVKKLIQAAEYCFRSDEGHEPEECDGCPSTDDCPFYANDMNMVLAIRDHYEAMLQRQADIHDKVCDVLMADFRRHGRAEVVQAVREWASKTSVEDMTTECCGRLLATLDELAREER